MRFSSSLPLLALLLLGGCATLRGADAPPPPPPILHAETFGGEDAEAIRTLIVVLHGDSPDGPPSYHYAFARTATAAIPDSVAIALLRPGYGDGNGGRSPGERGLATGDNYTPERLGAVAQSIRALRARYPGARTVLVGHSGGAAIAADLAGTQSGLIDAMVLVSCPCSLPEWRQHMEKRLPDAPFEQPVDSLDPLQTAGGVSPSLRAALLVGSEDQVTPPRFSRDYAEALALRGIATDYRVLTGKGHEILNDPEVLEATARLAASLPQGTQ